MTRPLLDVLIPAYVNARGVNQLLEVLHGRSEIRVLVSDDSPGCSMQSELKNICAKYDVTYLTGPQSGAPNNWNFLLKHVKAEFFVLAHHDECFSNLEFLDTLKKNKGDLQALILPIKVTDKHGFVRTVFSWQQVLLLKFFMPFAPLLNILGGPTACCVLRSINVERFDPQLVYLVDCEWYSRVLSPKRFKTIYFERNSFVVSKVYGGSITSSIKSKLRDVIEADKRVLKASSWAGTTRLWACFGLPVTFLFKLVLLPSFLQYFLKKTFRNRHAHH